MPSEIGNNYSVANGKRLFDVMLKQNASFSWPNVSFTCSKIQYITKLNVTAYYNLVCISINVKHFKITHELDQMDEDVLGGEFLKYQKETI